MRRLAVFVEGYTEVLFIEKLITEIAGNHNVVVETIRISGGTNAPRSITSLQAARAATNEAYFVLIVDCGGDHQVATRIREEHESLTAKGYQKIIGLRDVRPDFAIEDVPALERGLRKYIKTSLIPVEFILALMEIEAWFIAEHNHFVKIDPTITLDAIEATLGFNPEVDDITLRSEPRDDLETIYGLAGKQYVKPAENTIGALDFTHIYTDMRARFVHVDRMMNSIDDFMR